jgi:hypothetical protein
MEMPDHREQGGGQRPQLACKQAWLSLALGTNLGHWDSKTGLKLSPITMNSYKGNYLILLVISGGQGRNRTTDTRIFSPSDQ